MPVRGVEKFNATVSEFLTKLPRRELVKAKKKIGMEAFTGVVKMMPVDTGRARGSVQVTINRSADPEFGFTDPGKFGDDPGAAHEARALAAMTGILPFEIVHVGSNLVYIEPLEDGHSTQAPAGMFGVTAARLEAKYGSAKL